MSSRINLQNELETLLGCTVYFDPPESIKISYPCVIYSLDRLVPLRADNKLYQVHPRYHVMCCSKDPDNTMALEIMNHFQHVTFESRQTRDHIHMDNLTLYYWKE